MPLALTLGRHRPLGATLEPTGLEPGGVNFALYSQVATRVELCLFDPAEPTREIARFDLPSRRDFTWHGFVVGLPAGALYGFRVHGPWDPARGQRCNPSKLLVDPYAKALHGEVAWDDATLGHTRGADDQRDPRDGAAFVPRSVVVDDAFDWDDDAPPATPWRDTLLYELHVRGFSRQHPEVPDPLRGTYAGLAHPAAIAHLRQLGVTAVELLPVHAFVDDAFLVGRGLTNYWGYSTLAFFAPAQRYASERAPGAAVREFKAMVKALHRAGIEVILDVVYNHTCEGDHGGPMLSLKGIDNALYYVLDDAGRYLDVTGCGNTVRTAQPAVAQLIADSLRYWVRELHVDGFRFDLATTLGRTSERRFAPDAALLQIIAQDPLLSRVKLIAEPWDLDHRDGYQLGSFPAPMREWNDKFRDAVRRFWRHDDSSAHELAERMRGSAQLFTSGDRGPLASINFITAHDGFTLRDLVSYEHKHNEDNGEQNRDGSNHNTSSNGGVEGETSDAVIIAQREQRKRNLLATLLLSQGVPMLLAGDELGRTQRGNNNAYCQDSPLSWLDWQLDDRRAQLLSFAQHLIRLRREQPLLRQLHFTDDRDRWLHPQGRALTGDDWREPLPALALLMTARVGHTREGPSACDALLVLLNSASVPVTFTLPREEGTEGWSVLACTADPAVTLPAALPCQATLEVPARATVVLGAAR